jgi:hypothetical protein
MPIPSLDAAQPIASAAQAWIWTMQCLVARRAGAALSGGAGLVLRACDPDDVVLLLDRLYRQRRIDRERARVLRIYGERSLPPSAQITNEWHDARLWDEAMGALEPALRAKGLVA